MPIPIPDFKDDEMEKPELKIAADIPAGYDLDKSEYQYHLAEAGRSTSFIIKKSSEEKFVPASILGQGGYGRVRLFISEQDSSHMFAVKNALQEESARTQADINGRVRASIREIAYLAIVNPGLGPYLLRNFINNNHYDNRMLMPYFRGTTLIDFVITFIKTTQEFALLMLKVAQEVARVHQLGLFHGDVRSGNIMIERADATEFGITSVTVRIIDFDHGGEIGKNRFEGVIGEISVLELFLNDLDERTDVTDLRLWMRMCKNDLYITIPTAEHDIDKYFPAFGSFTQHSGESDDDPIRELHIFIEQITANLQAWEQLSKSASNEKIRANRLSLNLFWMKQDSKSEDDLIAEEWEATTSVL